MLALSVVSRQKRLSCALVCITIGAFKLVSNNGNADAFEFMMSQLYARDAVAILTGVQAVSQLLCQAVQYVLPWNS